MLSLKAIEKEMDDHNKVGLMVVHEQVRVLLQSEDEFYKTTRSHLRLRANSPSGPSFSASSGVEMK